MAAAPVGYVYLPVVSRDPNGGDSKRRVGLQFDFHERMTVDDVIDSAIEQVAASATKRLGISPINATLQLFDVRTKQLVRLERGTVIGRSPVVEASLAARGSVAFIIDDTRPGKGSFSVNAAAVSPTNTHAPQGLTLSPLQGASPPGRGAPRSRVEPARAIDAQQVGDELVAVELRALTAARDSIGNPHWSSLLPREPATADDWAAALDAEVWAVAEAREKAAEAHQADAVKCASVRLENDRLRQEIREIEAAVLERRSDFDLRADLQDRLDDLRDKVRAQAAEERRLMDDIEAIHDARLSAATAERRPPRGEAPSAHSPPPSPPRDPPSPLVASAGAHSDTSPHAAAEAHTLRSVLEGWSAVPEDFLPAAPPAHSGVVSAPDDVSTARHETTVESGLRLLPPDLMADVRSVLGSGPSPTRSPPRDRSPSATMRLLASDLTTYFSTEGSDAATRRHLLQRVRKLRGTLEHDAACS